MKRLFSNTFLALKNCFDVTCQDFNHTTATRLSSLKSLNDIHLNTDSGKILVMVLLDLSAAIDHSILLERLENWVGLSGTVLNWFESYLKNREHFVSICNYKSECRKIIWISPRLHPQASSVQLLHASSSLNLLKPQNSLPQLSKWHTDLYNNITGWLWSYTSTEELERKTKNQ